MAIEYREHGDGRYRVWSPQDAAYGSFHLVTPDQLRLIVRANRLMGVVVRHADNDEPIDMTGYRPEDNLSEQVLHLEQIGSS